jgi:LPXTG-site transpeptidase (sortase) family protein
MRTRGLAVLGIAVGVLVIVAGTVGLLVGRGSPAPGRMATVSAPTHDIVRDPTARPTPTTVRPGVLQSSYQAPGAPGASGTVAMPVSLTIPAIGVKAKVITLGLTSNGSLNTTPLDGQPQALDDAGWYTGSSRPGAIGPAIIAGHVNWAPGEGVFANLNQLHPGDLVYVTRADGSSVEFRVTRLQTTLKTDFPAGGVFGETPDAELRLITCGGVLDETTHHYLSNIIVYATEA